jgi:hypothetical protein
MVALPSRQNLPMGHFRFFVIFGLFPFFTNLFCPFLAHFLAVLAFWLAYSVFKNPSQFGIKAT